MSNPVDNLFHEAARRGLDVRYIEDRGAGDAQTKLEVRGPELRVHWWPYSRRQTAYVLQTGKGFSGANYARVCDLATEPPPIARAPARRKQARARTWKRCQFRRAEDWGIPTIPCHWCGAALTYDAATVDHHIPLARGGLDNPNNFVLACRDCNRDRGHHMPELRRNSP